MSIVKDLYVKQILSIGTPGSGTAYEFPETKGTDTQILTTNGTGNLSWSDNTDCSNNYTIKSVSSTPYTILNTEQHIEIDSSTLAITLTLPEISAIDTANDYKIYIITDTGGNSTTNNITINRSGSDTINGETSMVLNVNYSSVTLKSNGTNKWYLI
jgi:hypothetical protein